MGVNLRGDVCRLRRRGRNRRWLEFVHFISRNAAGVSIPSKAKLLLMADIQASSRVRRSLGLGFDISVNFEPIFTFRHGMFSRDSTRTSPYSTPLILSFCFLRNTLHALF